MEKIVDWWDDLYRKGEHLRRWEYSHPSPELVTIVAAEVVPEGGRTLDVGCGTGRDAIFLAECGFQASGLDWSDEALTLAEKRARERRVNVEWKKGDVMDLPYPQRSFDLVTDRGCLHHIVEGSRARYAQEVARVLKPGGHLFVRGCRWTAADDMDDAAFVAISEESIDRAFPPPTFTRGPVMPVQLVSDTGALDANMVLLRRT